MTQQNGKNGAKASENGIVAIIVNKNSEKKGRSGG